MNKYESIFIVKPELTTEDAGKILEFFSDNITKNGGKILNTETWGRMKLAYEIENCKEGYYFLINFEANTEYPKELTKRYGFHEDILRNIIVQLDGKKFKERKKKPAPKVEPKKEEIKTETKKEETKTETKKEETKTEIKKEETKTDNGE